MSTSTKDILVEITSNHSMEICKEVMQELLVEMLNAGLGSRQAKTADDLSEKVKELSVEAEPDESSPSSNKLRHTLIMQQVKTVDPKGNLKTVYPSRVDLDFSELPATSTKVVVNRLYDD